MGETKVKKLDQSRSWMLTIPADRYSRDDVEKLLEPYTYVGQLERGVEMDYLHWQVYVENPNPIKFETLRRKFPQGHFEVRRASRAAAYAYCQKADTFAGERISNGEIDLNESKAVGSSSDALRRRIVDDGVPLSQLVLEDAAAARCLPYLREVEFQQSARRFSSCQREVFVRYIVGPPGVGKTFGVFEQYGFEQTYSVSSYRNPWDAYDRQPVLLLDEFAGQVEFEFLLKLLEGYPLQLPARYQDRWAAYETVVMVSNLPLEALYRDVQDRSPAQWRALLRRISSYEEMLPDRSLAPRSLPSASVV